MSNENKKRALNPMGHIAVIEEKDFKTTIAKGTVLIDFYADWCGPCRMLTPILEQLQEEMKESLKIVKMDVDQAQLTAAEFDITSIPTILLFKNGQMKGKVVGLKNLQELKQFISL